MAKTIITERTYINAEKAMKKMKNESTVYKKLQAVKLAYKHGIKEASKFLNVYPVSIRNWAKIINKNDISSLKIGSKHKDGIKLKKHHKEKIKEWISKDSNVSIMLIKEKLEKEFGLEVSRATVHRAMQSCGFSYITPRKNHYKQDKIKAKEFKKKSEE